MGLSERLTRLVGLMDHAARRIEALDDEIEQLRRELATSELYVEILERKLAEKEHADA